MKKIIPPFLLLICNVTNAAVLPCEAWEYARLKDSTEEELTGHVCVSKKKAENNTSEQFKVIGNLNSTQGEMDKVEQAVLACREQVTVGKSVYTKKFGKPFDWDQCKGR